MLHIPSKNDIEKGESERVESNFHQNQVLKQFNVKYILIHTREVIKCLDHNTRLDTCVPQSPTWFRRRTSTFENSNMRANVSPIIVDLK